MNICRDKDSEYNHHMDTESKLKNVLESKGLRPIDFARMMNTDSQTVANWCRRGVPSSRLLESANVLRVPVDQLAQSNKVVKGSVKLEWETEPTNARDFINKNKTALVNMSVEELLKLAGRIESLVDDLKDR
jgi:transcriptional regulator with XRE-family HTH domain